MAVKYGLPGAVSIGGKELAYMTDWSLEQSMEIVEKSFFRGKGKEKSAGIKDWSASCNGQVSFEKASGHQDLLKAFDKGEKIELRLDLNEDTYFKGEALIESINIDNSAEGEYNIEISVAGSGGIELTVPAGTPGQ